MVAFGGYFQLGFYGSNLGASRLATVGRLVALRRVRYRRFHCIDFGHSEPD